MKRNRILVKWNLPLLGGLLGAAVLVASMLPQKGNSQTSSCPTWNGIQFVSIPAGTFTMGANYLSDDDAAYGGSGYHKRVGGAFKDELPRHSIRISSFCFMRDSLTREQAEMLR